MAQVVSSGTPEDEKNKQTISEIAASLAMSWAEKYLVSQPWMKSTQESMTKVRKSQYDIFGEMDET